MMIKLRNNEETANCDSYHKHEWEVEYNSGSSGILWLLKLILGKL